MKKQTITRRELLKVLAATGTGITAAAFLPAKWVKPIVNSGVLPVHAQASGTGSISGHVGSSATINVYAAGTAPATMKIGYKVAKPKPGKLCWGGVILYTATTDADNNYNIPNVTPGMYDITCSWGSMPPKHDVVVTAGNITPADFDK